MKPDTLSINATLTISSVPFAGCPVMIWIINQEGIFQFIKGDDLSNLAKLPGELVGLSIFKVYADYPVMLDKVRLALSGINTRAIINQGECYWYCQFYSIDGMQESHKGVIGVSSVLTYVL